MSKDIQRRSDKIRSESSSKGLFNDTEINDNSLFKLLAAIECGDAVIEFYDLQKKKFFKEIDVRRPFLIGVKMNCWTSGELESMHKVFSYNKFASNLLNKAIQTKEIQIASGKGRNWYDILEWDECLAIRKKFRRNLLKEIGATTTEQQKLLLKLILYKSDSFKLSYSANIDVFTPFIKQRRRGKTFQPSNTVTPRFKEIEERLINEGLNVKYLNYYDLISFHKKFEKESVLTSATVKKYIKERTSDTLHWKDRERILKSYESQIAYLYQNHYYIKAVDDKHKNTAKKALKLLSVNENINAQFFPSSVQEDFDFITGCLNKPYRKALLTNPALKRKETLSKLFDHALATNNFLAVQELPAESFKAITQDKSFSERLKDDLVYRIQCFNNNFLKAPAEGVYENGTTARIELEGKRIIRMFRYFAVNFHKECFTKEFLLQALSLTNNKPHVSKTELILQGENVFEDLEDVFGADEIDQLLAQIKMTIFSSNFFNKFPSSIRKPYEKFALSINSYNFNKSSKATRLESIYEVAKKDFEAIGFARLFGKSPNYSVIASCIEKAIEGMIERGRTDLQATHSEPDSHIKALLIEAGLDKHSIKHMGYTYQNLQDMLITIRMKTLQSRLPEKGIKTKKLKI